MTFIDRCYYLVRGQKVYGGPFATRGEAEEAWKGTPMTSVAIFRDGKLIEVG